MFCSLVPQKPGFPELQTSFRKLGTVSLTDVQTACPSTHGKLKDSEPGWAAYSPGLDAVVVKCNDAEHLLQVHTFQSKGKSRKEARDWWAAYRDRANPAGLLLFR